MTSSNETEQIEELIQWHQTEAIRTPRFEHDDRVYCPTYGGGTVHAEAETLSPNRIRVFFPNDAVTYTYTTDGKYIGEENNPDKQLTHHNPKETPDKDWHEREIKRLRELHPLPFSVGTKVQSTESGEGTVTTRTRTNVIVEFHNGKHYNYTIDGRFKGAATVEKRRIHAI